MTNRLLVRTETKQNTTRQQRAPRILVFGIIGLVGAVGLGLLALPILVGTNAFFAAGAGCSGQQTGTAGQPPVGAKAKSIPANYLSWYKRVGQQYGVPWPILAGIGTVESNNGQTTLPGVHSNPSTAIFAYNHLQSYVQSVLYYAGQYAGGNFSVASAAMPAANSVAGCATAGGVPALQAPTQAVATAITFAEQQLGKPYLWGGTGPDAFDCSGLVMMAYRAAGIGIARTSQAQWASEQRVSASQVQPGDLVFFAGADGTTTDPGHVGLVIGNGKMIEAYATGFPIRVSSYANVGAIGFTQPWANANANANGTPSTPGTPGASTAPPAGGVPTPGVTAQKGR